jgi:hypothetical protein
MIIREKNHQDKLKRLELKSGLKTWASNFKTKDLRIIAHFVDDYFVVNYNQYINKHKYIPIEICGFFAYKKNSIKI